MKYAAYQVSETACACGKVMSQSVAHFTIPVHNNWFDVRPEKLLLGLLMHPSKPQSLRSSSNYYL